MKITFGVARKYSRVTNLICFHLTLMTAKNMLSATNEYFYEINERLNNLIIVLLAVVYVYVFVFDNLLPRLNVKTALILVLCFLFFLGSSLFTPDLFANELVRSQFRTFIAYCLPLFILCTYESNPDDLLERLFDVCTPLFFLSSVCFYFAFSRQQGYLYSEAFSDYSMSFGYSTLFLNVLLLFKYESKRRIIDLLFYLPTIVYIFLTGSRGPLIYIAISLVMILFIQERSNRKIIYISLTIIASLVLLIFYSDIMRTFLAFLDSLGISSRTVSMLLQGNIQWDTGRSEIHHAFINAINQHPVFGLGAFGGTYRVNGLAHGIFLDTFSNFGFLGGGILFIIIIYHLIRLLIKTKGTLTYKLIIILLIFSFGGATFGGAFFEKKELWMLFGFLIGYRATDDFTEEKNKSNSV